MFDGYESDEVNSDSTSNDLDELDDSTAYKNETTAPWNGGVEDSGNDSIKSLDSSEISDYEGETNSDANNSEIKTISMDRSENDEVDSCTVGTDDTENHLDDTTTTGISHLDGTAWARYDEDGFAGELPVADVPDEAVMSGLNACVTADEVQLLDSRVNRKDSGKLLADVEIAKTTDVGIDGMWGWNEVCQSTVNNSIYTNSPSLPIPSPATDERNRSLLQAVDEYIAPPSQVTLLPANTEEAFDTQESESIITETPCIRSSSVPSLREEKSPVTQSAERYLKRIRKSQCSIEKTENKIRCLKGRLKYLKNKHKKIIKRSERLYSSATGC